MSHRVRLFLWVIGIFIAACLIGYLFTRFVGIRIGRAALPSDASRLKADKYYVSCSQAVEDQAAPAQQVEVLPPGVITRSQVAQIANDVMLTEFNDVCGEYGFLQPYNATFPDGKQRLTWAAVCVTNVNRQSTSTGDLTIIYMEANTGQPLMVMTGARSGDLGFACPLTSELWSVALQDLKDLLLLWAAATVGLLVAAVIGTQVWRARRQNTHA